MAFNHNPLLPIQPYSDTKGVGLDCKEVKELIITERRIFINVKKQVNLRHERINLPPLGNNQSLQNLIGKVVPQ